MRTGHDGGWRGPSGAHHGGGGEWVVRLRGLPFSATEEEIVNWFAPMPARRAHIVYNNSGRPSGDAFAEFDNEAQWEHAMSKNRQHMGARYVEIFSSSRQELMHALGPLEPPPPRGGYPQGPPPYEHHAPARPYQPGNLGAMSSSPMGYGYGTPSPYPTYQGGYTPAQGTMSAMGTGVGGPLGAPGVDPTIALLHLTSALSQQAAQVQARAQGTGGQSQLDMMMRQAATPGWPATASATSATSAPAAPYPAASAVPAVAVPQQASPYAAQGTVPAYPTPTPDASTKAAVTLRIRGRPHLILDMSCGNFDKLNFCDPSQESPIELRLARSLSSSAAMTSSQSPSR